MLIILLVCVISPRPVFPYDGRQFEQLKVPPAHSLIGEKGKIIPDYPVKKPYSSPYWDNDGEKYSILDPEMFNVSQLYSESVCQIKRQPCDANREYRKIDGYCNNIKHPSFGSSHQVLSRLRQPVYDNGIMRIFSVNGNLLPNPRAVSNSMKLMNRRDQRSDVNVLWLIFGQFIDHDFSVTPMSLGAEGTSICSVCSSWRTTSTCAPILIPKNDKHFPPFSPNKNRRCLPFVRSAAVQSKYGPRNQLALEQLNDNTAYLDLSTVYGSHDCKERSLRLYHFGQLVVVKHPLASRGMLPLEFTPVSKDCRSRSGKCTEAGDERSVENLALQLFHLVFLREHNRLAESLYRLNKHWSDEKLFQEARRINIAQYQKIIYDEFLPILLGKTLIKIYGLESSKYSYYKGYNKEVNPNVLTEFATAAFRVGHTMVPDNIFLLDSSFFPKGSFPLRSIFRNTTHLYKENVFEDMARGMLFHKTEPVDPIIESSLQDNLFIKNMNPFTSQDLISLNIARGRDHGIPGYTSYLSLCGLETVQSWKDLKMYKDDVDILKTVYSSVHDVDLFVGGLAEFPLDGLVGPTFGCIIAKQFRRSKIGDSFWFENELNRFSIRQLESIREDASLSSILVKNLNRVSSLPKKIFEVPSTRNPLLPTKWLRNIELKLWKEENKKREGCHFGGKDFLPGSVVPVSQCLRCFCDHLKGEVSCQENVHCGDYKEPDKYCEVLC